MSAENATIARRLTDALNAGDGGAIASVFAEDGVFLSARAGRVLTGPDDAAAAMMDWLSQYRSGSRLETIREFYTEDEGYSEWRHTGVAIDGSSTTTHGVDYFRFRNGRIVEKSSFRKV